jgi:hypothetical protein
VIFTSGIGAVDGPCQVREQVDFCRENGRASAGPVLQVRLGVEQIWKLPIPKPRGALGSRR